MWPFFTSQRIPTDVCLVVLGWLQGTDTTFIFASAPPSPSGFCWSQEWVRHVLFPNEYRSVCNIACSRTPLADGSTVDCVYNVARLQKLKRLFPISRPQDSQAENATAVLRKERGTLQLLAGGFKTPGLFNSNLQMDSNPWMNQFHCPPQTWLYVHLG